MAKGDLTAKQRLFLDALSTGTRSQGEQGTGMADADAARTVGVAMSSVYRWKNIPKFWGEYQVVVGEAEETLEDAMALGAEDRQQLAADQAEALTKILPSVVREHIRIALSSPKDADRLRAIEKLYSAIGFGKDEAPPPSRQNKVFLQMLSLMAPQVAAEAARRGLPVSSTVKEVIAEDFAQTMLRLEQGGYRGRGGRRGVNMLTPEERLKRGREAKRKYRETHREEARGYRETHREEARTWREMHKEELQEKRHEYYEAHKEERREYRLKYKFNLSQEDYDRLFVSQGGVCAICGSSPNGKVLCVDHDHKTGEVRALLCNKCNRGLGYLGDDSNLLRRAADYIDQHTDEEEEEGE